MSGPRLAAAAATRAGRGREQNEDRSLVDQEGGVFLVADGMGGHAAGEVASEMAVASVHRSWTSEPARGRIAAYLGRPEADERLDLFRTVGDAVLTAHLAIAEEGERDPSRRGMGTTLTGLFAAGGEAFFAHAGDSRAYLVRAGAIQLTEDHSVQTRLRTAGIPAGRERRGILTTALGVGDLTRVARFAVPLASGDRFVLCTDGVHDRLRGETELATAVGAASDPRTAAENLVDLAIERGATDDATALVVEVQGPATADPDERARDARTVARCALFEPLSAPERLRALRIAIPRTLPSGRLSPLIDGDRAAYILLDGEAALVGGDRVGPAAIVYADGLIEGTAAPRGSATAVSPTRILAIRRADFLELTEDEPDLGVKLYAALARLMIR